MQHHQVNEQKQLVLCCQLQALCMTPYVSKSEGQNYSEANMQEVWQSHQLLGSRCGDGYNTHLYLLLKGVDCQHVQCLTLDTDRYMHIF